MPQIANTTCSSSSFRFKPLTSDCSASTFVGAPAGLDAGALRDATLADWASTSGACTHTGAFKDAQRLD